MAYIYMKNVFHEIANNEKFKFFRYDVLYEIEVRTEDLYFLIFEANILFK